MSILSKKPNPPTLDEREASARATAAAALSTFRLVAADLDDAAAALSEVAATASDEAFRLHEQAQAAAASAEENRAASRRILALVDGEQVPA